ncbi:hypothetical protein ZIOFF_056809 [Zingiber officinale]|uniref:Uncharacterized protein n=1 Tax=Zingiber officinale TaxID=94328 RepID=A0A8J5FYJ3_ZINOF|nr:hypothetical protein ZIOFF_056809 [Zingiber officinale]
MNMHLQPSSICLFININYKFFTNKGRSSRRFNFQATSFEGRSNRPGSVDYACGFRVFETLTSIPLFRIRKFVVLFQSLDFRRLLRPKSPKRRRSIHAELHLLEEISVDRRQEKKWETLMEVDDPTASFPLAKWRSDFSRAFQYYLDKSTPHATERWIGTAGVAAIYCLRVYLLQGFYIISYGLGIYLLNLLIGFLSPLVDPELEVSDGLALPTRGSDEFKPFVRRLPEFKFCHAAYTLPTLANSIRQWPVVSCSSTSVGCIMCSVLCSCLCPLWVFGLSSFTHAAPMICLYPLLFRGAHVGGQTRYSITKAFCVAFVMTFFSVFDVPVFWPILLCYWVVLFFLTMKRQITHMIKFKYVPFSLGKQVSLGSILGFTVMESQFFL